MSKIPKKTQKMRELLLRREIERKNILSEAKSLRNSLMPHNLFNRLKYNARTEGVQKAKEVVALAKSKPGAMAAVGGLALSAILWKPAILLYNHFKQSGNSPTEFDDIDQQDDDE